jgi:predicted peroxiredoxin
LAEKGEAMKKSLLVVSVAALILSVMLVKAQNATRDGVFIHISHGPDDPHRVLMALRMAEMMSEDRDVLVYFDIKAVEIVLKDAPDVKFKEFPTAQAQIKKLGERKVTLMACPGCLKAAGKTAADLAPGIQIADKTTFFNFTKGRILSLDY